MKLTTPVNGCYVCLEGIKHRNRFMTIWNSEFDCTKSAKGETWYKIIGYADTRASALDIIYCAP